MNQIEMPNQVANSTYEFKINNSFNPKKLFFLFPIILALGLLFASSIGGVGLFAHSTPQWLTNIVTTVGQPGNWIFLIMMIVGGVLGLVGVVGGIYGMAKKDTERPIKYVFVKTTNNTKKPSPDYKVSTPESVGTLENEVVKTIEYNDPISQKLLKNHYTIIKGSSDSMSTLYAKDATGQVTIWKDLPLLTENEILEIINYNDPIAQNLPKNYHTTIKGSSDSTLTLYAKDATGQVTIWKDLRISDKYEKLGTLGKFISKNRLKCIDIDLNSNLVNEAYHFQQITS